MEEFTISCVTWCHSIEDTVSYFDLPSFKMCNNINIFALLLWDINQIDLISGDLSFYSKDTTIFLSFLWSEEEKDYNLNLQSVLLLMLVQQQVEKGRRMFLEIFISY